MIAPMEKVTILIFHKAKDEFLRALQNLGVLHVSVSEKEENSDDLREMNKKIERCENFLSEAKDFREKDVVSGKSFPDDVFSYVESFEANHQRYGEAKDELEKLERQLRNLEPWGDFDINQLRELSERGINVRFYISPAKKFDNCREKPLLLEEIFRDKTYVYFVVFEKGERLEIDCDEFIYPDTDRKKLSAQAEETRKQIRACEDALRRDFSYASEVEKYLRRLKTSFFYQNISSNLDALAEGKVYVVCGWVPRKLRSKVAEFLDKEEVYFDFSMPQPDDNVPILLENNRFSRLFEPITKMFSLPNYAELDLTAFFAPFFTLFFGFCLGDAGYGLIIMAVCLLMFKKVPADKRAFLLLGAAFGFSTFVFGVITGNLFGVNMVNIPVFKKLVLLDSHQLFYLSLKIGVVQIFFGMLLKALSRIRQFGFMYSLSTWGWLVMLSGVLPLVLAYLGKTSAPAWAKYCALGGLLLILLFNDLKANIFVRIGKGLWELYGGLTGFLGDVLSYVRLFALGISSSILGFVFNDIALQCRHIPYVGFLVTFVLLVVLHTINFALGMLSSFVHPLRLTFVEFYKNAGFEGGGKAYNPFRKV